MQLRRQVESTGKSGWYAIITHVQLNVVSQVFWNVRRQVGNMSGREYRQPTRKLLSALASLNMARLTCNSVVQLGQVGSIGMSGFGDESQQAHTVMHR